MILLYRVNYKSHGCSVVTESDPKNGVHGDISLHFGNKWLLFFSNLVLTTLTMRVRPA
jgi:hypothetical protein